MNAKIRTNAYLLIILPVIAAVIFSVFNAGCKKSSDGDDNSAARLELEQVAGYTAATVSDLGGRIYGNSILIIGTAAGKVQGDNADALQIEGYSYDDATGWWSFTVSLDNEQSANIRVKFLDSGGNFHKYYNLDITTIESDGSGTGPNGSFSYTFTITGIELTSGNLVINGSGTAAYDGTSCNFTLDSVTYQKLDDGVPDSGSMVISSGGATFTVTFDGTESIEVTYSYMGQTYTVTINLETGSVT